MNKAVQQKKPNYESVWAILQEVSQTMQDTTQIMQDTNQMIQDTNQTLQELAQSKKDTDRKMKELQKTIGGWANNHGSFAEEYFFNSFENGKQNFFGEKFDEIEKHLSNYWQGLKDEYDIVLYNHTSVAIIEVKYKAHINDIPDVLKKAETFRILFPQYKDFKIYLGLASMSFYPELEESSVKHGIAVIKQVGDMVIINDSNLKVF